MGRTKILNINLIEDLSDLIKIKDTEQKFTLGKSSKSTLFFNSFELEAIKNVGKDILTLEQKKAIKKLVNKIFENKDPQAIKDFIYDNLKIIYDDKDKQSQFSRSKCEKLYAILDDFNNLDDTKELAEEDRKKINSDYIRILYNRKYKANTKNYKFEDKSFVYKLLKVFDAIKWINPINWFKSSPEWLKSSQYKNALALKTFDDIKGTVENACDVKNTITLRKCINTYCESNIGKDYDSLFNEEKKKIFFPLQIFKKDLSTEKRRENNIAIIENLFYQISTLENERFASYTRTGEIKDKDSFSDTRLSDTRLSEIVSNERTLAECYTTLKAILCNTLKINSKQVLKEIHDCYKKINYSAIQGAKDIQGARNLQAETLNGLKKKLLMEMKDVDVSSFL